MELPDEPVFRLRRVEILLVVVFAACVAFQLFVPPLIGLADNGDFGKIIGRFSLGTDYSDADQYRYFTRQWHYHPKFFWLAGDRSSEVFLASLAISLSWQFGQEGFDVRVIGAIQAFLWIGCFAPLLPLIRRRDCALAVAALFVLTDVSYVAYCNTFYRDTATMLFLGWAIVLWLYLMLRRPTALRFTLFLISAALCASSKAQHAALGMFFTVLAIGAALRFAGRFSKLIAAAASLALIPIAWATLAQVGTEEKTDQIYGVIFMKILHNSRSPSRDLAELGLSDDYLQYAGKWPSAENKVPVNDPQQRAEFRRRTSQGAIGRFFLLHPWRALSIVYRDLHLPVINRRTGMGNYDRDSGQPPFAQTSVFGWWSYLRTGFFRFVPWHIIVWYTALIAMSVYALIQRSALAGPLAFLALALAGMALSELAISSLGDAGETDRHLFVFHVLTDFTMLLAGPLYVRLRAAN